MSTPLSIRQLIARLPQDMTRFGIQDINAWTEYQRRLSPDVVLKVVEALECVGQNLTTFGGGAPLIEARFTPDEANLIREALRLLNPQAQPGEQK